MRLLYIPVSSNVFNLAFSSAIVVVSSIEGLVTTSAIEDIETGAKAALRGGFTSVVLMANTNPVVDNAETLTYVLEKGKKTDLKVYTCATVTKGMSGKELTDMELLFAKGAVGFTDDGKPILDTMILEQALKKAAALKVPVSLHEENPAYIQNNGVNAGTAAEYFKIAGSPREAEISMIERDLQIALETGAILNIQHISTKEGVALVREAKRKAAELGFNNIHAEATPHHFSLTQDAVLAYGTLAKMNPPLREEADRQAVIEGLKDGTIDMIATDHAPHTPIEKGLGIKKAPFGIVGLETAASITMTELVDKGYLTIMQMAEKMSYNPAKILGLDKGAVEEGKAADLVVFHPKKQYVIDPAEFKSKGRNTPFAGKKVKGMVMATIANGRVLYERT